MKIYTREQVAEILQVSTQTVTKIIKEGKLKAFKIKGWRISEEALNEFIQEQTRKQSNTKQ